MKDAYYFPHDSNATQDPKIMAVLSTCGLEGVGMYWILVEILHQQPSSKILFKSYEDYIDFYGRLDGDSEQMLNRIKQMLITTELFVKDGEYIYSRRILENKKRRDSISKQRSKAGKKSALIRGFGKNESSTNVEQNLTSVPLGKERKGKEIKVNIREGDTPQEEANKFFDRGSTYSFEVLKEFSEKSGTPEETLRPEFQKFILYWTERNKSGTKQRWEQQSTFEVKRRLATWLGKINSFSSHKGKGIISSIK